MHIFVINLPKDQERRQAVGKQFSRLRLDYEVIPGVNGEVLSKEELVQSYNQKKALRIQCRPLVPAEIGCALSHIAVYRTIIERQLPYALILEDDVELPDELPRIINALERRLDSTYRKVILLSPAAVDEKDAICFVRDYRITSFKSGCFAHAYIVTRSAASALLKFLYPVADVADCWTRLKRHRVVDIEGVTPAVIAQNQVAFGSSTTIDLTKAGVHKIKENTLDKFIFKSRRAFWLFVDWILAQAQYHRQ